ncbi:hypothetical protein Tco_0739620, partial [Tanacetum coccineum]
MEEYKANPVPGLSNSPKNQTEDERLKYALLEIDRDEWSSVSGRLVVSGAGVGVRGVWCSWRVGGLGRLGFLASGGSGWLVSFFGFFLLLGCIACAVEGKLVRLRAGEGGTIGVEAAVRGVGRGNAGGCAGHKEASWGRGDDRYAVSNGSGYAVLISLNEYAVLDRELDTSYPMEVDTPYSAIDQNSARIRRIFLDGYSVL